MRITLSSSLLVAAASAQTIDWTAPCSAEVRSYNSTVPLICGILPVPLDYTAVGSNQTIDLQLVKIPASTTSNGTEPKTSVLFNFGGPGGDGYDFFITNAFAWKTLLGSDRDLILPNPRGVGNTLPFTCSNSVEEDLLATSWTSLNGNSSDTALGQLWGTTALYANQCRASANATAHGDFIGTTFVARDFMQVVDALDEDNLIHYYGFSYGTVLGATIATIFPDRIGGMLLDGNSIAAEYYQSLIGRRFTDVDLAFADFCAGCISAPTLCPLAGNYTADELEEVLYNFFDRLKYHPLPITYADGNGALADYTFIVTQMYDALYTPTNWPAFSQLLKGLMDGKPSVVPEASITPNNGADVLYGIQCGDSNLRTQDPDTLADSIAVTAVSSRLAGGLIENDYICAHWPYHVKENFAFPTANSSVVTKNPIMLISNTADPAAPLLGGMSNNVVFKGSSLLQHNGVGHVSLHSQGSYCTGRAIRAYWMNGTLPVSGTVCNVDFPAFALDDGWSTVFQALATES